MDCLDLDKRPFQCLLCPKSYSQSSALKVHYRTHTNERNYGCEVCSKLFTNASDLTKHKRIHDPDSKIACEFCDAKFAQRVNYRNHCINKVVTRQYIPYIPCMLLRK